MKRTTATISRRVLIQHLVESGGPLAEIVSRMIRDPQEAMTPQRLRELKSALVGWDACMMEIDEKMLETIRTSRQPRIKNVEEPHTDRRMPAVMLNKPS